MSRLTTPIRRGVILSVAALAAAAYAYDSGVPDDDAPASEPPIEVWAEEAEHDTATTRFATLTREADASELQIAAAFGLLDVGAFGRTQAEANRELADLLRPPDTGIGLE